MNPQEKAEELRDKFIQSTKVFYKDDWKTDLTEAKKCALILVEEIILEQRYYGGNDPREMIRRRYWNEVKEHLTNLN